jgi:hypothetical protein
MKQVAVKFVRPLGLTAKQWDKVVEKAPKVLQSVTPVDTGNLKNSVETMEATRRSVTVGYSNELAPYATYVENGNTRGAPAQNMTGRAEVKLEKLAEAISSTAKR